MVKPLPWVRGGPLELHLHRRGASEGGTVGPQHPRRETPLPPRVVDKKRGVASPEREARRKQAALRLTPNELAALSVAPGPCSPERCQVEGRTPASRGEPRRRCRHTFHCEAARGASAPPDHGAWGLRPKPPERLHCRRGGLRTATDAAAAFDLPPRAVEEGADPAHGASGESVHGPRKVLCDTNGARARPRENQVAVRGRHVPSALGEGNDRSERISKDAMATEVECAGGGRRAAVGRVRISGTRGHVHSVVRRECRVFRH